MTSLLQYFLIIASVNVGVAFALYIGTDEHWLTYFSDTEITVSVEEYRRACERIIGYPVNACHQSEIDRIFASRPDNETYLIGRIGPHADGNFTIFDYDDHEGYTNFENETAARSGDFGIAYFDFPNNWWKVAPLMGQRKMRYICEVHNPCISRPCTG